MEKDNKLYEKYEALINKHGISTYEVCKETGIDVSTMSNWKNGKYVPKVDKIKKITDYFGISLEDFIE